MKRKDAAAIGLGLWSLIVAALLYVFQIRDLEGFTALVLLGMIALIYLIHPVASKPRFYRRLTYVSGLGIVLIFIIVAHTLLVRFHI